MTFVRLNLHHVRLEVFKKIEVTVPDERPLPLQEIFDVAIAIISTEPHKTYKLPDYKKLENLQPILDLSVADDDGECRDSEVPFFIVVVI